jgi:flagellar hook-associated protein 1 FlgK
MALLEALPSIRASPEILEGLLPAIVEQYRGFIYTLGSDTANADLGMRQHEALVNQLENRRQEVSGVSIDEETVKIIQFQRAFEASARVVRAVDELLQLTLSLGQ